MTQHYIHTHQTPLVRFLIDTGAACMSATARQSQLLHFFALLLFVFLAARPPLAFAYRISLQMVEGHGCHRVVAAHRRLLLGHVFKATSPNGRFTEGAKLIDGRRLARIEAVGKNLFYFWLPEKALPDEPPVVVHIHFGMSGAFSVFPLPGKTHTPTTRLSLINKEKNISASLSAMTCVHGGPDLYESKYKALGPDPLREDADKERLWLKMQSTSKAIGQVLMDQSFVAGIGNIYRAEILFKSSLHPEQPACTIPRTSFETLWMHSVLLLQRGFTTGSILTVDPAEAALLGPPWTRRYIYNHGHCGRCGSAIQNWTMVGRTVYCCPTCQPLSTGTELAASRKQAIAVAREAKEFVSHCAGEDSATLTPAKMTVALLRSKLEALGESTRGKKAELVSRLSQALLAAGPASAMAIAEREVEGKEEMVATIVAVTNTAAELLPATPLKIRPGTLHLGPATSARRAAWEKRRAGENRASEHVALHADEAGVEEKEEEDEALDVMEEVLISPSSGEQTPKRKTAARKSKRQRQGSSKREWAAEVPVPGSVGMMDDILTSET